MKALANIKRAAAATVAAALVSVYAITGAASAIPYDPSHQGTTYPAFNQYTGVPQEGDERDFLRGKQEGTPGASVTDVQSACTNGARYTLRVYVHNIANQTLNDNGNGSGVAKGTKVRVLLPSENVADDSFQLGGVVSANNASTVNDGMTINCANGKQVKLSYVKGSAKQFTARTGTKALSDSIVTTGAPVGTVEPNGDVWGCFGQRVWVTLTVEVKEAEKPQEQPKISAGVCKAVSVEPMKDRTVKVSVSGEVSNAQIIGYRIDFGDGTVSDKQTDTHKYAADRTYVITGYVKVKYADGRTEWKTAQDCVKQVSFKEDKPPVVTPPKVTPPAAAAPVKPVSLPKTGAGDVVAAVLGATILGTVFHRLVLSRRLG